MLLCVKQCFYILILYLIYQGLHETSPDALELENKNALALAIVPVGKLLSGCLSVYVPVYCCKKSTVTSIWFNYCR